MLLSLLSCFILPAAAQPRSVFRQHEDVAIYTSASVTRSSSGAAAFGVASYLNPPEFIELYSDSGVLLEAYTNGTGWYGVDMARHIESPTFGSVDTFGVRVAADGSGATVLGFASASAGAGPAWSTLLPGCSLDGGGGTYVGFEASDSGASVAVQCYQRAGANATAGVFALDGQTGAVRWHFDLGEGVKAGQGQVQITGDGAWVLLVNEQGAPTPNSATAYVLDGATGKLRDAVAIPFFIAAAISDSGNYLALGDNGFVHLWEWDAPSGKYAPSQAAPVLTPPASSGISFLPWDVQMSTGPDAAEFVVVGSISVRCVWGGGPFPPVCVGPQSTANTPLH